MYSYVPPQNQTFFPNILAVKCRHHLSRQINQSGNKENNK